MHGKTQFKKQHVSVSRGHEIAPWPGSKGWQCEPTASSAAARSSTAACRKTHVLLDAMNHTWLETPICSSPRHMLGHETRFWRSAGDVSITAILPRRYGIMDLRCASWT